VEDDKDEHRDECSIHELPLGHTPFTILTRINSRSIVTHICAKLSGREGLG
jgi:hypothetical protein